MNKLTTPCVEHTYYKVGKGYALLSINYKKVGLHRAIYCNEHKLELADIAGKVIMHTCDNPKCINPAHLVLGTYMDNSADRDTKGHGPQGDRNPGAKLTSIQVDEIRTWYAKGTISQRDLAKTFNVSQRCIGRITSGSHWK